MARTQLHAGKEHVQMCDALEGQQIDSKVGFLRCFRLRDFPPGEGRNSCFVYLLIG